jgi:CRISPR/Cas system CMR subunit Cmr4 (Cas7 group RAMP superfamily)
MNKSKILYLFTRTPLHVGAGASVGAIDQPIIRERHTGFPIISATSTSMFSRKNSNNCERSSKTRWRRQEVLLINRNQSG